MILFNQSTTRPFRHLRSLDALPARHHGESPASLRSPIRRGRWFNGTIFDRFSPAASRSSGKELGATWDDDYYRNYSWPPAKQPVESWKEFRRLKDLPSFCRNGRGLKVARNRTIPCWKGWKVPCFKKKLPHPLDDCFSCCPYLMNSQVSGQVGGRCIHPLQRR